MKLLISMTFSPPDPEKRIGNYIQCVFSTSHIRNLPAKGDIIARMPRDHEKSVDSFPFKLRRWNQGGRWLSEDDNFIDVQVSEVHHWHPDFDAVINTCDVDYPSYEDDKDGVQRIEFCRLKILKLFRDADFYSVNVYTNED
jgi:hypothetical protein